MAQISITGIVSCREGDAPVTLTTTTNGNQVAKFSVFDREYYRQKEGEEVSRFYTVEIWGKPTEIAADRIKRGTIIGVHGTSVNKVWNGKIQQYVSFASAVYPEKRDESVGESSTPQNAELPF